MRIKRLFGPLLLVWLITSCSDSEVSPEVEMETVFSITLGENQFDRILLLTNDTGNIIETDSIERGNSYVYEMPKGTLEGSINVHFIGFGAPFNGIESHLEVNKGANWVLKDRLRFTTIGEATVTVTNFPKPRENFLPVATNSRERLAVQGVDGTGDSEVQFDNVVFTINLVQDQDTLLIGNAYQDGEARYIRVNDVRPGDELTFDFYEDFIPYETSVIFEASEMVRTGSDVFGHKAGAEPQIISSRYDSQTDENVTQLGYMEGYDYYTTFVGTYEDFVQKQFFKIGAPATASEIAFLASAPVIQDDSYTNLSISNANEFQFGTATYTKESGERFVVTFPCPLNRDLLLTSLPEELMQERSDLFDGLNPWSIRVNNNLQGDLHPDRLPFQEEEVTGVSYNGVELFY